MTTEKLTDEERAALADGDGDYQLEAKALRLLDAATAKCDAQAAEIATAEKERNAANARWLDTRDELDAANAKCEALAAALDRVRAWYETRAFAHLPKTTCDAFEAALAAAPASGSPKHTGPSPTKARIDEYHGAPDQTGPTKLHCDLAAANARVAELERDREDITALGDARVTELEAECGALESHARAAESLLDAANARVVELEARSIGLGCEVTRLQDELDAANARVAELEAMNRMQSEDLAAVSESLHAANTRADAAERYAKDREEAVRRLVLKDHQAADQYQSYMAAADEDLQRAESELAEVKAKCEAAEAGAKVHYEARQCAEQELEQALEAMGQATLMNRAEAAEADLADANAHLKALHDQFDRAESECAEWKAKCEAAERAHEQALNERDLAHQQIELENAQGLFKQNERLRQVNKELLATRSAAESKAAALRAELHKAYEALGESLETQEALRAEVEHITGLLDAANEALEKPCRDCEALCTEVERLEANQQKLCDKCCYTHRPNEGCGRRRDVD